MIVNHHTDLWARCRIERLTMIDSEVEWSSSAEIALNMTEDEQFLGVPQITQVTQGGVAGRNSAIAFLVALLRASAISNIYELL